MRQAPTVYFLTDITRRSNEHRRVIVQGFDVRWRTVLILLVAVPAGLLLSLILWPIINTPAILACPLAVGAGFWLVEHRSRTGLQLPMYRWLLDRKSSSVGQFFMCGRRIDPARQFGATIMASTVPVHTDRLAQAEGALGVIS